MSLPPDLTQALTALTAFPRLLVAVDFDGTLAPLVSDPAAARPYPGTAQALRDLAARPATAVAVISGRALGDLAALTGLDAPVHLVGSHGAEFDAGFAQLLDDGARELHARLLTTLKSIVDDIAGVGLEVKPASVAVHVRNAAVDVAEQVLREVREGPAGWAGVHVTEGKSVIELAVLDTDKGAALELLRERTEADAAVFFGDDVTDEKAFRRLRPGDVGVKVGEGESNAAFRVAEPADVLAALKFLLQERTATRNSRDPTFGE